MAKTFDLRTYLLLERAFARRLQRSWRTYSAPLYARITQACIDHKWDEARRLVPELDMTEVGTQNREWITYMLLSCAVFGAGTVAKSKPSFVGTGSFDTLLKQVTNNILQYLEHTATPQVQAEALQAIAEDEAKTKAVKREYVRDEQGRFAVTGTAAFKAWFGQSKVVDGEGHPLVVHHGTNASTDFEEFNKTQELGYHFGTAEQASWKPTMTGGRVIPAYLSLQNPIRMPDHVWDTAETATKWAAENGFDKDGAIQRENAVHAAAVAEASETARHVYYNGTIEEHQAAERIFTERKREHRKAIFRLFKAALEAQGYDGIVYKNEVEGTGDSYIAFHPHQIKSAIGNTGAFDPKDPRITKFDEAQHPRDEKGKFAKVKLSPEVRMTLDSYGFPGTAWGVNERLRQGITDDAPTNNTVAVLDSLMKPGPAETLHRVVDAPLLSGLKVGDTYTVEGYTATLRDTTHLPQFEEGGRFQDPDFPVARQRIEVQIPAGHPRLDTDRYEPGPYAMGPVEGEVVLPRKTTFRVVSTSPKFVVAVVPLAQKFDETLHPRDPGHDTHAGEFIRAGMHAATAKDAETLKALGVPPAWVNVQVADNPKTDLQVTGEDEAGRTQYKYSAAHNKKAKAEKFARRKEFAENLPHFRQLIAKGMASDTKAEREQASVLFLIDKTGFRIGSKRDTKAKVQAYGASTLLGKHVRVKGDTVFFNFVAKKGVHVHKAVTDPALAKMILARKGKPNDPLFKTSDSSVRTYMAEQAHGFSPKDFRTHQGTGLAMLEIQKRKTKPKTEKEFKRIQKKIATVVATHLGNTAAVSLKDYIDPSVWDRLRNP